MKLPKIKSGWILMKTTKIKPMGYKGYCLTLYEKDDITIMKEFFSKTLAGIERKYRKYKEVVTAYENRPK